MQDRLYNCVDVALDGGLWRLYPDSFGKPVAVRLDCYNVPELAIRGFFHGFPKGYRHFPTMPLHCARTSTSLNFGLNSTVLTARLQADKLLHSTLAMFKRGLPPNSPWRRFQRGEWILWLLFVGFMPGVFVLVSPLDLLFDSDALFAVVAIPWMIAFFVAGMRLAGFRCPRCSKPFLRTWWYQNGFTRRCVHCSLPRWEDPARG